MSSLHPYNFCRKFLLFLVIHRVSPVFTFCRKFLLFVVQGNNVSSTNLVMTHNELTIIVLLLVCNNCVATMPLFYSYDFVVTIIMYDYAQYAYIFALFFIV